MRENKSLSQEKVILLTNEFNNIVLYELTQGSPNEKEVLKKGLAFAQELIENADYLDIKLYNPEKNAIYVAAAHGSDASLDWPSLEYPLNEGAHSISAKVFLEKCTMLVETTISDEKNFFLFHNLVQSLCAVPLIIKDEVLGVLSVLSFKKDAFSKETINIIEFIASQFSLYYNLLKVLAENKKLLSTQSKIFNDFLHQIRTPIVQNLQNVRLVKEIAQRENVSTSLLNRIEVIAGLSSKIQTVSRSIGLFSSLQEKESLKFDLTKIEVQSFLKLLNETIENYRILINPASKTGINLNVVGDIKNIFLLLNINAFDHCINCVLDNAIRYSYPGKDINVLLNINNNILTLIIENVGIPISKQEVLNSTKRGWRGEKAMTVTGEGSGVGLWITQHIMKALYGELEIVPTNINHITQVKLILPILIK